jgi:predicted nucleic acid-binding Zn ribbon protein
MEPPAANPTKRHRRLGLVLFAVFALAMVMGPGPGLRLVNPEPTAARESLLFLGLPVIYAWGLFWYGVQAAVVVTACLTIWKPSDD